MRQLVYLDRAKRDLTAIIDFIEDATGDIDTGYRVAERIKAQCRKLAELPSILGCSRPELGYDLRSFPLKNYLIFFRYREESLEVVGIIGAQRDIKSALGEGNA